MFFPLLLFTVFLFLLFFQTKASFGALGRYEVVIELCPGVQIRVTKMMRL
jgi:hypothetical protein